MKLEKRNDVQVGDQRDGPTLLETVISILTDAYGSNRDVFMHQLPVLPTPPLKTFDGAEYKTLDDFIDKKPLARRVIR